MPEGRATLFLVAVSLAGCAEDPDCAIDETPPEVSFSLRPEHRDANLQRWTFRNHACVVSGVAWPRIAMTCPDLPVGTSSVTLFLSATPAPPPSLLKAGDALTLAYHETRSSWVPEKYLALRRDGRLVLAAVDSVRLRPDESVVGPDFFAPLVVGETGRECETTSGSCGRTTGLGMLFATPDETVEHASGQYRSSAHSHVWVARATAFEDNGSCDDTLGRCYNFLYAAERP